MSIKSSKYDVIEGDSKATVFGGFVDGIIANKMIIALLFVYDTHEPSVVCSYLPLGSGNSSLQIVANCITSDVS